MSNAANFIESSYDENHFLPQSGFGSDVTFDTISRYHRYLFRVYTPSSLPAVEDQTIFFVGARFNNTFAPQTPIISEMYSSSSCASLVETATYEDCVQHLSWETRSRSPFISATFSFAWALWDAVRRFNTGIKHDVEIAVIDATALSGKAVTTLQMLRRSPSSGSRRHPRHWKWCRFAQESQSVLIHGFVPRSAVLASVPLRTVVQNLPSYFLKTPSGSQKILPPIDSPLGMILAWDPTGQKNANFHRFCQDMGDRFRRMPYQSRVREIAIGSVRLAMALLDPWFHRTVQHGEIHLAVTRIRELSALIAHWPEQPGSRDYNEMASLMKALILLLAEELPHNKSRRRQFATEEVLVRVQKFSPTSPGFAESRRQFQEQVTDLVSSDSDSGSNTIQIESESEPSSHRSFSKLRITIPGSGGTEFSSCSSPSSVAPLTPESDVSITSLSALKLKKSPHSQHEPSSPVSSSSSHSCTPSHLIRQQPEVLSSLPSSPLQIAIPLGILTPITSPGPLSIYYSALKSPHFEFPVQSASLDDENCAENSAWDFLPAQDSLDEDDWETVTDSNGSSSIALHEVVSYAVTGFLVGTAITLCIMSSQRRTMLYLT
ncbi:hypothetical protein DFH05DRAFT_954340 [Lentinula detonsa]|uniref:DUF7587 domain-containing protein n=1 Tax=Lentinula detonsa TaxID=2804962 RepID=A0A9W8P480_9AGAR|nr:hypothetical protein DFH05DRAFT_954340 [Lentinula detonsa]